MIAIVVAVVLVAGTGAFLLFRGGGGKPGPDKSGGLSTVSPGSSTPEFHFRLRSTKVVATGHSGSSGGVKDVVNEVRDRLSTMYALAFLDPSRWQRGDYETVYGFFSLGKTAAAAKRDTEVLTLGANAGDTFESVEPKYGGLVVRVLTDKNGNPFTTVATADFTASGKQKNGKTMVIKSHATYYLQSGEGGWIIVGYKAKRSDHTGEGSPAPEASGSGGSG